MNTLLTFDLDNTLWDVDPVIVRAEYAMESWFEERFPGFSQQYSSSKLESLKQTIRERSPEVAFNLTALRLALYEHVLKNIGLPSEERGMVAQAALAHFNEWRQRVDLYPHVTEVLGELKSHCSLAVITNGNADVFHPYIGLGKYFDFALRADQFGVAKPDESIFYAAAKSAGIDISQLIHVGDHPIDDVCGASNAGAKSIWFNRHGARHWSSEWRARPDAEVHTLLELPSVIQALTT